MSDEKDDIGAILNTSMDEIYDSLDSTQDEAAEKPRDESGKFTKAEQQGEPEAAEEAPEEATEEVAEAPKEVKPVKAPATWGRAVREKFATLDPEVQAEILKREADQARGIQRYAEDAKYAHTIRQIVAPYEHIIRAEGGTPEAAIQDLLNTAALLRTGSPQQKAQVLLQAAHTFGADLSGLIAQQQQLQQMPPEYRQLVERQAALEAEIARRDAEYARQAAMREQSEVGAAFDVVHQFANATDEGGSLKYPHFDTLRPMMVQMLESGIATDLQDAYAKAEWSVPEIRQQRVEAEAAKKAEELRRANASKARTLTVKSKGVYSGVSKPATIEETMSAVYDSLTS